MLVFPTRDGTVPPALEARSLNHWTTGTSLSCMVWKTDPKNVLRKEKLKRFLPHFQLRHPPLSPSHILTHATLHDVEAEGLSGGLQQRARGSPHVKMREKNARQDLGNHRQRSPEQRAPVGKRWLAGQPGSGCITIMVACSQVPASSHPRPLFRRPSPPQLLPCRVPGRQGHW